MVPCSIRPDARGLILTEQGEALNRTVREVLRETGDHRGSADGKQGKARRPVEGNDDGGIWLRLAGAPIARVFWKPTPT